LSYSFPVVSPQTFIPINRSTPSVGTYRSGVSPPPYFLCPSVGPATSARVMPPQSFSGQSLHPSIGMPSSHTFIPVNRNTPSVSTHPSGVSSPPYFLCPSASRAPSDPIVHPQPVLDPRTTPLTGSLPIRDSSFVAQANVVTHSAGLTPPSPPALSASNSSSVPPNAPIKQQSAQQYVPPPLRRETDWILVNSRRRSPRVSHSPRPIPDPSPQIPIHSTVFESLKVTESPLSKDTSDIISELPAAKVTKLIDDRTDDKSSGRGMATAKAVGKKRRKPKKSVSTRRQATAARAILREMVDIDMSRSDAPLKQRTRQYAVLLIDAIRSSGARDAIFTGMDHRSIVSVIIDYSDALSGRISPETVYRPLHPPVTRWSDEASEAAWDWVVAGHRTTESQFSREVWLIPPEFDFPISLPLPYAPHRSVDAAPIRDIQMSWVRILIDLLAVNLLFSSSVDNQQNTLQKVYNLIAEYMGLYSRKPIEHYGTTEVSNAIIVREFNSDSEGDLVINDDFVAASCNEPVWRGIGGLFVVVRKRNVWSAYSDSDDSHSDFNDDAIDFEPIVDSDPEHIDD
jgi:hypothetical protein